MAINKITKQHIREFHENEIRRLYNEGYSINDIADALEWSFFSVDYFLKKNNLKKTQPGKIEFTSAMQDKVVQLFDNGKSTNEIASDSGVPHHLILAVLNKNKGHRVYKYSNSEFMSKRELEIYKRKLGLDIKSDFKNGMVREALAIKYNVTRQSIGQMLKAHDVDNKEIVKRKTGQSIAKDYKNGMSRDELALKYNLSRNHIGNFLKVNNIPGEYALRKQTGEMVRRDYNNGMGKEAIRLKYNLSAISVNLFLQANKPKEEKNYNKIQNLPAG